MHRLTDYWSNLFQGGNRNVNETLINRDRLERIERISETFRNLYWKQILSLQNNSQEFERHPMADDIVEAWNEIDEIGRFDVLYHKIYFDPKQFLK